MTPLLTDEDMVDAIYPLDTTQSESQARELVDMYSHEYRAIEQAVMKRAYQRAAELCDSVERSDLGGHCGIAQNCRAEILKLMEE